ncbi:MAG: NAD-dependent epimerase/dehydratase family protein, partial [Nitrospinales bacterium]
ILDQNGRVKSVYVDSQRWKKSKRVKDNKLQKIIVNPDATIKQVIKILDTTQWNIVLIVDEDHKFLGLVTERDIRDAILEGHDAETPIGKAMNANPITGVQGLSKKQLIRLMDSKIELSKLKVKVPILDEEKRLKDLAIYDEFNPDATFFFVDDDEPLFKNKVRSVLITGGAGYIGSVLCRKLLDKGFRVRVLDTLLYGDGPVRDLYPNSDFELIQRDIRHIEDVVSAIQGMDAVIHLGAIVGDAACALGPRFTIESNYLATKLLADICKHHQVNRFLFSSTCSVYGASADKLHESSELNPVSLYARSKIYSENAILEIMDENFSPTILRLGTIFGLSPRLRFDLVLNLFVAKAMKEEAIEIEGGKQYRPMVHVRDAANAFIACLEAPIEKVRGEIFNIGSNEQNFQILDLGKEVIRHIPRAELRHSQTKQDNRDYWVYFDKIKSALGFRPAVSLEEGIKELIEFIDKHPGLDYLDRKYYNHQILPTIAAVESQSP